MKDERNTTREETLIDPNKVFSALGRKFWVILLVGLLCGGIVLTGLLFLVTPKYEASVKLYVNNRAVPGESMSSGDLDTSRDLTDSCVVILNTRETLCAAIEYAKADYTYAQLKGMVRAEAVDDTEILEVTVRAEDPQMAEKLANAIAHVLPLRVSEVIETASVKIVEAAVVPESQCSPNYVWDTIIAFLVGTFLSAIIITLRSIFNTKGQSTESECSV